MNDNQLEIIELVEAELPEFSQACKKDTDMVIMHQDSFAADYQFKEIFLLGAAIKYAGIYGKEVRFTGSNRETLQ